jgi:ATP-dependent protease ClpP protease subunit
MALISSGLTPTASAIITATNQSVVTSVFFNNRDTNIHTINVYLLSQGGTLNANNCIFSNININPKDTYVMDYRDKLVLETGDMIYANSDTTGNVGVTISYASVA